MNVVFDILNSIKNNSNENKDELEKRTYNTLLEFLPEIKIPYVRSSFDMIKIDNISNSFFTHHPYGSQSFPDFYLCIHLYDNNFYVISLECKSSKTGTPVWNCSIPTRKNNVIYIIENTKTMNLLIINGLDIISEIDYNKLILIKDLAKKFQDEINILNKDIDSWSYYVRNMFNQTKKLKYQDKDIYFNNIMNQLSNDIMFSSPITPSFLNSNSKDNRLKLGQFFTPNKIKNELIKIITSFPLTYTNILEPSFGSGEFLFTLKNNFPQAKIFGYEIDPDLCSKVTNEIQDPRFVLRQADFLSLKIKPVLDLVIGNPPYVEDIKSVETNIEKFADVSQGRGNLFIYFIKHGIDSLKDGGILAYIIPSSIKTSPWCEKIRDFLNENTKLLVCREIEDKFSSEIGVNLSYLIVQKKYQTEKENVKPLRFFEPNFTGQTMKDLGCTIRTGPIVWNQHKDKLTDDPNQTLLIYSSNLSPEGLKLGTTGNLEKKQFIESKIPLVRGPCILISRSHVGCDKYFFEREEKEFLVENHVNIVEGPLENLKKFLEIFTSEKTKKYLNDNKGTRNLSKTQLLNIPL